MKIDYQKPWFLKPKITQPQTNILSNGKFSINLTFRVGKLYKKDNKIGFWGVPGKNIGISYDYEVDLFVFEFWTKLENGENKFNCYTYDCINDKTLDKGLTISVIYDGGTYYLYKDFRLHPGLDFSAPTGTPIYATSDGVVQIAGFNTDGYGNKVVINHGYGFQTLYAHMVRVKAKVGQSVKRGEVIGYVGSTGKSTGPHLHYEVIKRGAKVDPVYYFFNDLTPAQFDRLLKEAAANKQSLD